MTAPNRDLGSCWIIWDSAPGGTPITWKKTFGGVFFRYEELRAPIHRDQAGLTEVDNVTTGAINPEIEAPFTQEDVEMLYHVFANRKRVANSLQISNPVGDDVLKDAKRVTVKRIVNGVVSDTPSEWIVLHRAFPRVTMEQVYDNAGQRCVKVMFKGFPDDISGRQNRLWDYGRNE